MINLEWYRIFWHTAKAENLTRAADELHITQPSVSYALKQLEQALEVKLYHRLARGIQLTAEGEALLAYVEQSLQLLEAGKQQVQSMKQLDSGQIRIGASDSLIKHLLLPHLNAFHAAYPGVRIRLSRGKTLEVLQRLHDRLIDCAIVHMPIEDPRLNIRQLAQLETLFVAGEAYRHLQGRSMAPAELAALPLLMLSPGSSTRVCLEQWFATHGHTSAPDMELGSIELLAEFARLGYGAAFTARSFVQQELDAGTLFELRASVPLPWQGVALATRNDLPLSLAAERFIQLIFT